VATAHTLKYVSNAALAASVEISSTVRVVRESAHTRTSAP
jgi:hypothetical protein